jgi:S-DNA-T family DNA segregation ATPase FtsK/SpoIIIE
MEQNSTVSDLTSRRLTNVLSQFGVTASVIAVHKGPIITQYEVELKAGIRASKVIGLATDIARCMTAPSARIALVPGSTALGIELPNAKREVVSLVELLGSPAWDATTAAIPIILGKNMTGAPVIVDLAKMPHLLIAGTTGSGKSIGIHAMISSVLANFTAKQCRLILVDPKMLEMSQYARIPHLLTPVINNPEKAIAALKWTCSEMERRYRVMSQLNVRNIAAFNASIADAVQHRRPILIEQQVGYDDNGDAEFDIVPMPLEPMPFIVVVIDEVADLMMLAGKEIEMTVQRLAQMSRAAGIHLIMATQRPSVDIITGSIKANFPSRISFQLQSKIDSRTILGQPGAEQLLGNGDLLLMEGARLVRIQGAFVSTEEIETLVRLRCAEQGPAYIEEITDPRAFC